MNSEEITFREPDYDQEEGSRDSAPGQSGSKIIEDEKAILHKPDYDGEQRQELRPEHALLEDTGLAPTATAEHSLQTTGAAEDARVLRNRNSDNVAECNDKQELAAKDDTHEPTPSIELAPTQSPKKGDAHRVVKKKTHLHRSNRMYSERVQRHTALMKTLGVVQNIWTMVSTFPYWDMAFWSGFAYAVGSAMFIVDGAFAFGPLASPDKRWPEGEDKFAGPILFFLGAVICYQTGAVMAYLEAINDGCFAGVAMKRFWIESSDEDKKKLLDAKLHTFFGHIIPHHHHHESIDESTHDTMSEGTRNKSGPRATDSEAVDQDPKTMNREVGSRAGTHGEIIALKTDIQSDSLQHTPSRRQAVDHGLSKEESFNEYMTWRWWPTWHALRTYHLREVGYVACSIQLIGAILYSVTGVVVLPGVLSSLAWWQKIAAFWVPQIVASLCFLTAAIMFTLESQDVWYKPLPGTVRWWIGGWAAIGSVGFLLCACFGLGSHRYTWCEYQSDLSSLWGSAAYLFSSLLQWYEAVSAGPVLAFPNNRTPALMRKPKANSKASPKQASPV